MVDLLCVTCTVVLRERLSISEHTRTRPSLRLYPACFLANQFHVLALRMAPCLSFWPLEHDVDTLKRHTQLPYPTQKSPVGCCLVSFSHVDAMRVSFSASTQPTHRRPDQMSFFHRLPDFAAAIAQGIYSRMRLSNHASPCLYDKLVAILVYL